MIARCLLAAILALSAAVRAQEQPAETAAPPPAEPMATEPGPIAPAVAPLKKGASAPFAGLLVPEARFTELLQAELKAQELEGKVSIHEKTVQALDTMYLRHLERATEPVPWYRTESFARWTGFGLGVVCTGLAVWGAVEFGKAIK